MLDPNKFTQLAEFYSESYNRKMFNEATYYGRNKYLEEAEDLLSQMVELGHNGKINSHEFIDMQLKVAEKLRVVFGFYSLTINSSLCVFDSTMTRDLLSSLGISLCTGTIIKYTKIAIGKTHTWAVDLDKHHKAIQFKPNSRYCMRMFINSSVFMDNGEYSYTGAEILAIMLHEIGHNFYVGPIHELSLLFFSLATSADILALFIGMVASDIIMDGISYIEPMLPLPVRKTIMLFTNITGAILGPFDNLNSIKRLAINIFKCLIVTGVLLQDIISAPVGIMRNFIRYDKEKYSDSFVAAYGYGAELSSAVIKTSHMTIPIASSSTGVQAALDFLLGVYNLQSSFLLTLLEYHPNTVARLNNTIAYLDAAGKDIKDPKVRKEYEEQMKACHALKDEVLSYRGNNLVKVDNRLHAMVQDFTGITDIKDITSSLNPKITKYANLDRTIGR